MDYKHNGGPAFPWKDSFNSNDGMSLRDWFAGMALQGLLACSTVNGAPKDLVMDAYDYANMMLAERGK